MYVIYRHTRRLARAHRGMVMLFAVTTYQFIIEEARILKINLTNLARIQVFLKIFLMFYVEQNYFFFLKKTNRSSFPNSHSCNTFSKEYTTSPVTRGASSAACTDTARQPLGDHDMAWIELPTNIVDTPVTFHWIVLLNLYYKNNY